MNIFLVSVDCFTETLNKANSFSFFHINQFKQVTIHIFVAWVRLARVSHLWVWKISLQSSKFSIFYLPVKKKSHRVGSKNIQVKGGWVRYLITSGQ